MSDNASTSQATSPFVPSSTSVGAVMRKVIYALIPGVVLYMILFGWGIVINIVLASVSALLFEAIMLMVRGRPLRMFLFDGSAVVTAILLTLALPPMLSWWIPVLGSFFAIVVAKHLYGGLGYNPFNPAMMAYAILLVSFPLQLSLWAGPLDLIAQPLTFVETLNYSLFHQLPGAMAFDSLTAATPLDYLRTQVGLGQTVEAITRAPIFGLLGGQGMEWVNSAFLLGGLWLLYMRIISWHIPVAVLASIGSISGLAYFLDPAVFANPSVHLWGGASILCAFFIATDPITASTTPLGRIIYGLGIGGLTFAIRTWGGYPDGVAFAVLLMGLVVPLLDHYTVPKVFGARTDRGNQ